MASPIPSTSTGVKRRFATEANTDIPEVVPVFRPTLEDMQNFSSYVEKLEHAQAHKVGIAKVIPPKSWIPRKKGYNSADNLMIPSPVTQKVRKCIKVKCKGVYMQSCKKAKALTVNEYKNLCNMPMYSPPVHATHEELEATYWNTITNNTTIYGADVTTSLFDKSLKEFNTSQLNTIIDILKTGYDSVFEGVNTPFVYFGMWKTSFAWHTEDAEFYSVSYLHYGAPKSWYVIPPRYAKSFERRMFELFPGHHSNCEAFLRHKIVVMSPAALQQYNIPVSKVTQEAGEFIITFPYAYHSGFNHGFNCAEATNFALPRWIEYGKRTTQCLCYNSINIDMELFVLHYQPRLYDQWKQEQDESSRDEKKAKKG